MRLRISYLYPYLYPYLLRPEISQKYPQSEKVLMSLNSLQLCNVRFYSANTAQVTVLTF